MIFTDTKTSFENLKLHLIYELYWSNNVIFQINSITVYCSSVIVYTCIL